MICEPGDMFQYWTVLRDDVKRQSGHRFIICRCICGVERSIQASKLRRGDSGSCGCLGIGQSTRKDRDGIDLIALGLEIARMHLKPGECATQAFLAAFCGCSGERIRQIEVEALRKLRFALVREGVSPGDLLVA